MVLRVHAGFHEGAVGRVPALQLVEGWEGGAEQALRHRRRGWESRAIHATTIHMFHQESGGVHVHSGEMAVARYSSFFVSVSVGFRSLRQGAREGGKGHREFNLALDGAVQTEILRRGRIQRGSGGETDGQPSARLTARRAPYNSSPVLPEARNCLSRLKCGSNTLSATHPVEAVFVIDSGHDEADDEAARPP